MSVEAEVPTGRTIVIPVDITGTAGFETRELDVEIAHLGQSQAGGWNVIERGGVTPEFSAADWMTAPATITVPSGASARLELRAELPRLARGTYTAALLVSTRPPEGEGLRLAVRFLVPIILHVEGRPVRQDITLADAELVRFIDDSPDLTDTERAATRTTRVDLTIANRGGTYSRLRGDLYLDHLVSEDQWRQVRYLPIEERRILPGVTLRLPVDLERRLPSGTYRIRAELYVDGRRTAPLRKEIVFEGDPDLKDVAYELALGLAPDVFEFDYVAGSTRAGVIAVENPGIDPIEVTMGVSLPEGMGGRATRQLRGEDLSAADWIEVMPQTFTLRPGQRRNVRLIARFPDEAPAHENYYAALALDGRFLDGQQAGGATGYVEISRPGENDAPAAVFETVRFAEAEGGEPGQYSMSVRIANSGNVQLDPTVAYALIDRSGNRLREAMLETPEAGRLMPLVGRGFGGTLDLSALDAGDYALATVVTSGGARLSRYLHRIEVDADGSVSFETVGEEPIQ